MRRHFALALLALFSAGCSKSDEAGRIPLGSAATTQTSTTDGTLTGTLLEQIDAEPYSYLRLNTASGEVWAAVNQTPLTIGTPVTVSNVLLMEQFESKSLKRTFERIYFGALGAPSAASADENAPVVSVGAPPTPPAQISKVEKARGADARTIEELWAQKDALSGKSVTIRGVVVKYNPGVMGKNWIHLQDGSGNPMQRTHDITVTTLESAALDATITITGIVRLNRDFSAGYVYPLIIEDAKVVP
ncbi:MAG: nucleotide-binding protein [Gemmatimonadaceae bacterium]|nr:nucleotide-binding protein [Gemmatimonadaceae bacterium]